MKPQSMPQDYWELVSAPVQRAKTFGKTSKNHLKQKVDVLREICSGWTVLDQKLGLTPPSASSSSGSSSSSALSPDVVEVAPVHGPCVVCSSTVPDQFVANCCKMSCCMSCTMNLLTEREKPSCPCCRARLCEDPLNKPSLQRWCTEAFPELTSAASRHGSCEFVVLNGGMREYKHYFKMVETVMPVDNPAWFQFYTGRGSVTRCASEISMPGDAIHSFVDRKCAKTWIPSASPITVRLAPDGEIRATYRLRGFCSFPTPSLVVTYEGIADDDEDESVCKLPLTSILSVEFLSFRDRSLNYMKTGVQMIRMAFNPTVRWGSGHLVGKVTRWEFDSFGYVLHVTTADGTEVSVQEGAIVARASDDLIQSARVALPWPGLSTTVSFPCIMRLDKADHITQGNVMLVHSRNVFVYGVDNDWSTIWVYDASTFLPVQVAHCKKFAYISV